MPKPKVLLFDLETTPILVYTWGTYKQNVLKIVEDPYILCFGYKWLNGKTKTVSLKDYKRYKVDKKNDKDLVVKLHELLDEADIVIAHNGDRFDIKWANKQFIKHGLKPVSPYRTIDTLKVARRYFRFDSNRLDDLGRYLDVGRKVKHEGKELWFDVMDGDKKAWRKMLKYVKQDVELLEKVYKKLRAWGRETTNEGENSCTRCGSYNLQKRGYQTVKSGMKYQRYQCTDCGGWLRKRFGERISKPHKTI